jgi:ABC-type branched-subunit amino acid transport system substrate-binding protein
MKRTWQQGRHKDDKAPAVFVPVESPREALAMSRQTQGLSPLWLGASGWHAQETIKDSGERFEGAYLVTDYAPDDRRAEWKTFAQGYKEAYKEIPDRVAALGYDAVQLALAAGGLKSDTPYAGAQGEIRFDGAGRHNTAVPLLKISHASFLVQSGDCTRKP